MEVLESLEIIVVSQSLIEKVAVEVGWQFLPADFCILLDLDTSSRDAVDDL